MAAAAYARTQGGTTGVDYIASEVRNENAASAENRQLAKICLTCSLAMLPRFATLLAQ